MNLTPAAVADRVERLLVLVLHAVSGRVSFDDVQQAIDAAVRTWDDLERLIQRTPDDGTPQEQDAYAAAVVEQIAGLHQSVRYMTAERRRAYAGLLRQMLDQVERPLHPIITPPR